jgi:hypothetical protein
MTENNYNAPSSTTTNNNKPAQSSSPPLPLPSPTLPPASITTNNKIVVGPSVDKSVDVDVDRRSNQSHASSTDSSTDSSTNFSTDSTTSSSSSSSTSTAATTPTPTPSTTATPMTIKFQQDDTFERLLSTISKDKVIPEGEKDPLKKAQKCIYRRYELAASWWRSGVRGDSKEFKFQNPEGKFVYASVPREDVDRVEAFMRYVEDKAEFERLRREAERERKEREEEEEKRERENAGRFSSSPPPSSDHHPQQQRGEQGQQQQQQTILVRETRPRGASAVGAGGMSNEDFMLNRQFDNSKPLAKQVVDSLGETHNIFYTLGEIAFALFNKSGGDAASIEQQARMLTDPKTTIELIKGEMVKYRALDDKVRQVEELEKK